MTGEDSDVGRLLPAIPHVVLRDSVPARLALRLIEKALDYGWHNEPAEVDLSRGRQARQGQRWCSTAALDADLLRHHDAALRWLAVHATPPGFELRPYFDDSIVLIGRSNIL